MSDRIGSRVVIAEEKPQQCDECGVVAELRPYGKDFACVCHPCASKDRLRTLTNMGVKLFGHSPHKAAEIAAAMIRDGVQL